MGGKLCLGGGKSFPSHLYETLVRNEEGRKGRRFFSPSTLGCTAGLGLEDGTFGAVVSSTSDVAEDAVGLGGGANLGGAVGLVAGTTGFVTRAMEFTPALFGTGLGGGG